MIEIEVEMDNDVLAAESAGAAVSGHAFLLCTFGWAHRMSPSWRRAAAPAFSGPACLFEELPGRQICSLARASLMLRAPGWWCHFQAGSRRSPNTGSLLNHVDVFVRSPLP